MVNSGRNRKNYDALTQATPPQLATVVPAQIIAEGVSTDQVVGDQANGEKMVRVGLSFITSKDGSSTTLLLSEKSSSATPMSDWKLPTQQSEVDSDVYPPKLGFDWAGMNNLDPTQISTPVTDKTSSNHPGGVVVSFCDGHQYFLKTDLDRVVFMQLMTPYDKGAGDCTDPTKYPETGGIRQLREPKYLADPLDESAF
jgi:prepilin-type processing-associated H-X9-DG protein